VPLTKPADNGYPKYPYCVPAGVPAGAPLLKVYDYGPFGARFFCGLNAYAARQRVLFGSPNDLRKDLRKDPRNDPHSGVLQMARDA
jgi:hypothetical protein